MISLCRNKVLEVKKEFAQLEPWDKGAVRLVCHAPGVWSLPKDGVNLVLGPHAGHHQSELFRGGNMGINHSHD